MDDLDLKHFERAAQARIAEHLDPRLKRPRPQPAVGKGVTVKLAVREKRIALDTVFTHTSQSVSRLQATLEAERAARAAGYPIVGFVIDYE